MEPLLTSGGVVAVGDSEHLGLSLGSVEPLVLWGDARRPYPDMQWDDYGRCLKMLEGGGGLEFSP